MIFFDPWVISFILNKINGSGVPPHRLPVKVGAMIILVKNVDVPRSLQRHKIHDHQSDQQFNRSSKSDWGRALKDLNTKDFNDFRKFIFPSTFQADSIPCAWSILSYNK